MRLQRLVNRKVGDKTYYKWVLTLPPTIVEELGWEEGQPLRATVNKGRMTVERATEAQ